MPGFSREGVCIVPTTSEKRREWFHMTITKAYLVCERESMSFSMQNNVILWIQLYRRSLAQNGGHMANKLILHDLPPQMAERLYPPDKGTTVFCARPAVRHCVGCFGCWVKTPGQCVIADRAREFCAAIPRCDEVIIISKLTFGGLSPDVKAVLDRSIGYMLPFFRIVEGEMHHVQRFPSSPSFTYHFYQAAGKSAQKQTAQKLAAANALNFGSPKVIVRFHEDNLPIREVLL
jgi:hypothetical protein